MRRKIIKDAVYGKQKITDPLALGILQTDAMQRLQGVNQYGAWKYVVPWMKTTRLEHSLGVYFLLRMMGASREEQIAGLLHDIGHTAFSHAVDYAVGKHDVQDSNDLAQESVLMNSPIPDLVEKEGIDVKRIIDHSRFPFLEKELPDLCADRLDYILRDSLNYGITTAREAAIFLSKVQAKNSRIFFTEEKAALMLSERFMRMDREFWRSPTQSAIYHLMGDAMRISLSNGVISQENLFMTDDSLRKKMVSSGDRRVKELLARIKPGMIVADNPLDYEFFVKGKCRFIDPLLMTTGGLKRLSSVNASYMKKVIEFKEEHEKGHYIRIQEGENG